MSGSKRYMKDKMKGYGNGRGKKKFEKTQHIYIYE